MPTATVCEDQLDLCQTSQPLRHRPTGNGQAKTPPVPPSIGVFPDEQPLMLSAAEAARLSGLGKRTFLRDVAKGLLPRPVHIGGRTLWHRGKLEEFLKQKHDEAQTPED